MERKPFEDWEQDRPLALASMPTWMKGILIISGIAVWIVVMHFIL